MDKEFLEAYEAQRPAIRDNWENLLRLERINSPLANPDTLVHLLHLTLDEIFAGLNTDGPHRPAARLPAVRCPCGRNPLLAYFDAGRQAMREALVVVQAATPGLAPAERDETLARLDQVYDEIARREIETFCAICQFRTAAVRAATVHVATVRAANVRVAAVRTACCA